MILMDKYLEMLYTKGHIAKEVYVNRLRDKTMNIAK